MFIYNNFVFIRGTYTDIHQDDFENYLVTALIWISFMDLNF